MSEVDLLVECPACGADPHRACAEEDGLGGWYDVPSHHERVVDALAADRDRLVRALEESEMKNERLTTACHHWTQLYGDATLNLRTQLDKVRSDLDTMIRVHDDVEADRDRLAARLAEVEKERDEAFAKVESLYTRIESHPDYKSKVEWMERAVRAEAERDAAREECERMRAEYLALSEKADETLRLETNYFKERLQRCAQRAHLIEEAADAMMRASMGALADGDRSGAAREQVIAAREYTWAADLYMDIGKHEDKMRCLALADAVRRNEWRDPHVSVAVLSPTAADKGGTDA